MKADIVDHDVTGSITYFAVTVKVNDSGNIHELDVLTIESYEGNSGSIEYFIEDDSIEWITPPPDNAKKRDEIMSAAKKAATEHIENR
jgi:hypothetical protein